MGTNIAFKRADGTDASGYLAKPGRANAPGIVVIQEWWGVQDQIKGICDRLAAAGYEALAPDLYDGVVVPYHDKDAANREMSSLNFLEATDQVVRGAAQFLKRTGVKVGLTGFCLGGAVTIIGAVRVPEFTAGVCFYGIPPREAANPAEIRMPLQGHFADEDDWCTPQAVNEFEATCKAAGKNVEVFRYAAKHGFVNEQRPDVHERKCAEQAWDRMLGFWAKHLV
jgi:carboxymethylenebutenolidase